MMSSKGVGGTGAWEILRSWRVLKTMEQGKGLTLGSDCDSIMPHLSVEFSRSHLASH